MYEHRCRLYHIYCKKNKWDQYLMSTMLKQEKVWFFFWLMVILRNFHSNECHHMVEKEDTLIKWRGLFVRLIWRYLMDLIYKTFNLLVSHLPIVFYEFFSWIQKEYNLGCHLIICTGVISFKRYTSIHLQKSAVFLQQNLFSSS